MSFIAISPALRKLLISHISPSGPSSPLPNLNANRHFGTVLFYTVFHGPVIANVLEGEYTLTKSVLPQGEKQAPANSV